jgi:hypothetical protein|tara:strand:+ start:119 stop:331 length:213 start_codon:yes stop_codon:yes gene_type:complete
MQDLRDDILAAFESHAKGHVDKHRMNVEVYLSHPVGVGEHPDIMEAIEKEMEEIARYDDMLSMIYKYFKD